MWERKGVKLSLNYVKLSCYYMIVRHSIGWQQFASTKKQNVKKKKQFGITPSWKSLFRRRFFTLKIAIIGVSIRKTTRFPVIHSSLCVSCFPSRLEVAFHPTVSLSRTLLSLRVVCLSEQMQSQVPLAASLNTAISSNNSSFANLNELFLCWPHAGEYWTLLPHHIREEMLLLQPVYVCVLKLKIRPRGFSDSLCRHSLV